MSARSSAAKTYCTTTRPKKSAPIVLFGAAIVALGTGHAVAQSSSLLDQRPLSVLPEAVHIQNPPKGPVKVHQGNWGVFNRDDGSAAGFGPVARYATVRWAEDWSVLRDPSRRDDFFDPLKFIPLNDSKSIYLTLSMDERLRNWYETRPYLGTQKPNDSGRMAVRGLYGADLHLGEHLRLYGELVNGDAAGWGGYGYNSNFRKRLDIEQALVEAKAKLLGARTGVIVGRQMFLGAPSYVLFARGNPDVPLTWDGGRMYAVWSRVRLDLFDFVETRTAPRQLFRDDQDWNARLFGGYESWAPPDFKFLKQPGHVFLDFFYLGYLVGGARATIPTATGTQTGSTLRHNFGTRFWGKAGPIEFSLGGIYQNGEFRPARSGPTRDVSAFAINSFVGYRFASVYGKPLLGVQTDVYSGGNYHDKTGTIGTYRAPYSPQAPYLDVTTYIAPANLVSLAPTVQMTLTKTMVARLKVPIYWRESTDDAVYDTRRLYAFRDNFSGGYIGTNPQINLAVRITRHLTWSNDVARFFTSNGFQKAGASDSFFYMSTLDFRF